MKRAPYSTAEWGVEDFCELLAKAPSTETGRIVPFRYIAISLRVVRTREPYSAKVVAVKFLAICYPQQL
jgi:hypothetical protein